ncbi:MAG: hypothetical protein ACI9KN_001074 [Gammaproteobacteria bacterium]|jgi:hypothetical protein
MHPPEQRQYLLHHYRNCNQWRQHAGNLTRTYEDFRQFVYFDFTGTNTPANRQKPTVTPAASVGENAPE